VDTISLAVGIVGSVTSTAALIYAFNAAKRSEALLRRLVVYPYRELDVKFAGLSGREQSLLLVLAEAARRKSQGSLNALVTTDALEGIPEYSIDVAEYLERDGWVDLTPEGCRLNASRHPYYMFMLEASPAK
jgi:hypothetical protein